MITYADRRFGRYTDLPSADMGVHIIDGGVQIFTRPTDVGVACCSVLT